MNRHLKLLLPHGLVTFLDTRKARRFGRPKPRDRGNRYVCSVCGAGLRSFVPLPSFYDDSMREHGFPFLSKDFETLNVDQYTCPACGASDRERLYALYCDRFLASGAPRSCRMLDFSPSPALDRRLRGEESLEYATADLLIEDVDYRGTDIADLQFRDDWFDFIICSHVLEHVQDVDRSMRELHRVLKPGGRCIAMVPILPQLPETREDPRHTSASDRWRHYGQDDHVRLFSRDDFLGRLRAAGFEIETLDVESFGGDAFDRHGISISSRLYVGSKAQDPTSRPS